jgi:hypothetical protein
MPVSLLLIEVSVLVLIFNIPFGYWRYHVKRLSLQWFLAIHIPVPFIILARIFSDIGFHWITYVFLVSTFFLGQFIGGQIYKYRKARHTVSSCLVMDLFRNSCG